MDKMKKEIMVVPTKCLFKNKYFEGFTTDKDYLDMIKANYEYMPRGEAETNTDFKQPIPYIIIMNKDTVFAYQRSSGKNYSEDRLKEKWSIGLGGHIDEKSDNALIDAMIRELKEETTIENVDDFDVLGFINYDYDDVGKVHIGVLYLVRTEEDVKPKDAEIRQGRFYSKDELKKLLEEKDFEEWSRIALGYLLNKN